MVPTGITLELDIEARCFGCGAERELEGDLIASGARTVVAEAPTPCEDCGERRVKVTFEVGETSAKAQT